MAEMKRPTKNVGAMISWGEACDVTWRFLIDSSISNSAFSVQDICELRDAIEWRLEEVKKSVLKGK